MANEQSNQIQKPKPQSVNPFDVHQGNVSMPDVPISFGNSMAESLLNDNEVPKEIKARWWSVFHKDNTLTFLDKERKSSKLLNFDIQKIDILNTRGYFEYGFNDELEFGMLRNVLETKLDRAMGTSTQGMKNERTVLQSQFSENRNINDNNQDSSPMREGFFKRLLGRR
ncbi:MAG: hypothetical protein ACOCV1_04340 [Bacillota bacterium]